MSCRWVTRTRCRQCNGRSPSGPPGAEGQPPAESSGAPACKVMRLVQQPKFDITQHNKHTHAYKYTHIYMHIMP
eukprot:scaffold422712_cov25-Prasinocladus_malaysianus.AAC.1